MTESIDVLGKSGLSDTGPTVRQPEIVTAAQQAGEILADTATTLAALPPLTFDGGERVVAGVTAGMNGAAQELATGATSFAAIDSADSAAVQAGRSALSQQVIGSLAFLQDLGDLDPAVAAQIATISSCAELAQ